MRWLFCLLVLANVVAYFWFGAAADFRLEKNNNKTVEELALDGVKTLLLVAEVEDGDAVADIKDSAKEELTETAVSKVQVEPQKIVEREAVLPELSGESVTDNTAVCTWVGYWVDKAAAVEANEALVLDGVESKLVSREHNASLDYWLFIPPQGEKPEAKALLAELQERNIESYIIADGEYEHGITLGVFGDEENTRKYQQEIVDLGYSAKIKELPRTATAYWLEINRPIQDELFSNFPY